MSGHHDGRHATVPGNRWDTVTDRLTEARPSSVAVIVPYFEQPESLARMYAALASLDPTTVSLVVADDGSARHPASPPPPSFPLATTIVRQADLGCRPGAARNLAAAATEAEVLVFLDADTVPAPGTVNRLAAWPTVLPDALVVGRRHHADLTGWTPAAMMSWLDGGAASPPMRPDPAWLDDGYRTTRNLLDADERSYRFVISAVMACHRSLWDDVEGFDATRDVYGGDDWEFASRAYNNGAVLVHDPLAVAWHDEPDWAERDGGSKNDETLWLAQVIAEPSTRGPGVRQRDPALLVTLPTGGHSPGALVATIGDILVAVPDSRLHLQGLSSAAVRRYCAADDRVTETPPTPLQRRRARWRLHLSTPAHWRGLDEVLASVGPGGCGRLEVVDDAGRVLAEIVSTRAAARVQRAGGGDELLTRLFGAGRLTAADAGLSPLTGEVDLGRLFAGW